MTDEKLTKRFNLVAAPPGPNLRTKDNAQPRIKPPRIVWESPRGLAPPGMVGLRVKPGHDLAQPEPPKPPKRKFVLDRHGDLTREFTPLAQRKDRGNEHER